jgi:hypothetical protein
MLRLAYRPGPWPGPFLDPLEPAPLCGAPFGLAKPRGLTRLTPQTFLNSVPAILSEAEAGAVASSAKRNP